MTRLHGPNLMKITRWKIGQNVSKLFPFTKPLLSYESDPYKAETGPNLIVAVQVEASMDFAHGDWLTTFMTGSLNYQAVHHLFPYVCLSPVSIMPQLIDYLKVSQYYYPALAPIIEEVCARHNVKYNVTGSVFEVMALHTTRLSHMSKDPSELFGITGYYRRI